MQCVDKFKNLSLNNAHIGQKVWEISPQIAFTMVHPGDLTKCYSHLSEEAKRAHLIFRFNKKYYNDFYKVLDFLNEGKEPPHLINRVEKNEPDYKYLNMGHLDCVYLVW